MIVLSVLATLINQSEPMARNWDPSGYEETSKWAKVLAYEVIDLIPFQGIETILDVGTGDGKIAAILASKVPRGKVIAIDPSKEMIRFAVAHHSAPNLHFTLGDAVGFQTQEQFDLITSFTALHLVSDPERAMNHFYSLLNPQGRLFLKFPISDGFGSALESVMQSPQWGSYFSNYHPGWYFHTKENYEKWLSEAGFTSIRIQEGILDEAYNSKEELIQAVRHWLPHIQVLPSDLQDPFLNDLITLLLDEQRSNEFHHFEPFLFIQAVKRPSLSIHF